MSSVGPATHTYALFASGILAGVVTVVVLARFRLYSRRVRVTFALLSLSGAVWATGHGFQRLAATRGGTLFWAQVAWAGATAVPTVWLVFALVYAGEDQLLTRRMVAFLSVEPAVALALVLTSGSHDLFVTSAMVRAGVFDAFRSGAEPLFTIHVVYSIGVYVVGLSVVAKTFLNSGGIHRKQAALLTATGAVPFLSAAAALLRGSPAGVGATPVAFGTAEAVVLWAVVRYRLFDVTPVARDAILTEMRDAVVVLDDGARVVEYNGAASALFDAPLEACLGESVFDVVASPDDVRDVLEGRDRTETRVDVDGRPRYFEIRVGAVDGQLRDRAELLVFHDVTDRRQTEAEFRALIENSRDVISVADAEGTRKYTSPSVVDVLGYDPEALVGEAVFDVVHPDDRRRVDRRFDEIIESDDPVRTEFRIRHHNGTWHRFETVGVDLLDDPAVGGVVLNTRDVTDRHRYEQRLRVLNRVLRHDLRNDMNVILGHADLLLDEPIPVESKEHARVIKRKAESLVDLGEQTRQIDNTLDRGARGLERVEIVDCIERELDAIAAEYPRAIVHRHLPDEQWVYADDLVESAITNLIENALEHNDRVLPELSVTVVPPAPSSEFVEIRIADNGPGIPDAELSVLESGTETPLRHVSGLGLWLVKWIVDRSRGRLRFADTESRGTVAVVELRRGDGEGVAAESRASVESE